MNLTGLIDENMRTFLNKDCAKTSSEKETPVRSSDYVNLETSAQRSECYIEYRELEKSKENLSKAKQESELNSRKIIDYLHREKNQLMGELATSNKELEESKYQFEKLKEHMNLRESPEAPPIPTRRPQVVHIPPRYVPQPTHLSPGLSANPSWYKL